MSPNHNLRIAIASDQAIARRGLSTLVMSVRGVELVGQATSLAEMLQLCELTEPELLLVDLRTPYERMAGMMNEIVRRWPQIEVIPLIDPVDEEPLSAGHKEMTVCCFSRDISEEEFIAALQSVRDRILTPNGVTLAADTGALPTSAFVLTADLERAEVPRSLAAELDMAGRIQAGFLPEKAPTLPGWEITAWLSAARETSGDFYDFIPLSDNKLGIVVADVADKGMGAALFMALANTLIRNFAGRYPTLPGLTLDAVNERILSDTRGNLFLTLFFGVLETHTGRLRYSNGGHPPPLLVKTQRNKALERLTSTGMALGVVEKHHWQQKLTQLAEGDVLLLYTDGVTEAQNQQGTFFGEERLANLLRRLSARSAIEIQRAVLEEVQTFCGPAQRQDDIAVMVIRRVAQASGRMISVPRGRSTV